MSVQRETAQSIIEDLRTKGPEGGTMVPIPYEALYEAITRLLRDVEHAASDGYERGFNAGRVWK